MKREIVVNSSMVETRVAVLEDGHLAELMIADARNAGLAGNIYKGRVLKILPGMQAAFVDIGLSKDAFLYVRDIYEDLEDYEQILTAGGGDAGGGGRPPPPPPPQTPPPPGTGLDRRTPPGGARSAGPGGPRAFGHEGGPDHLTHHPPGPLSGLHAHRAAHRHLSEDRERGGAGPPPPDRAGIDHG